MHAARKLGVFAGALGAACAWASSAFALTAELQPTETGVVGQEVTFRVVAKDGVGAVQYLWKFGDDTQTTYSPTASEVKHTYAKPGHYAVLAIVKDAQETTSAPTQYTVHYPLTTKRPVASTDIVYDPTRNRVMSVNEDNDSITVVDAKALIKVAEVPVYGRPTAVAIAPSGKLWVVHRDDHAVAVVDLDKNSVERGFRLPYASQPMGIVMSPTGDAAYVTLMATGQLLRLNPGTGEVTGALDVGPTPRGVSVSADGRDVYVTRFISPVTQGEMVHVSGATFKVVDRWILAPDKTASDTDQNGRGLPNYVFMVALSPDGRQAWVASKKDNIYRGTLTDTQALSQDNTVRPQVASLDLALGPVQPLQRQDLDDRNLPSHIEFSPLGDFAFITCTGSNLVEVRDAYDHSFITDITNAGLGPRGSVLGPDNRLFVNGALGRQVVVYDVSGILTRGERSATLVNRITAVDKEKLRADVLLGKQLFTNSADSRMTFQGYLSCASCHFDGFEDGRVWDFTSQDEGLRNTPSLLGRRGNGQGRMLWSGSIDEVQDFEHQIRSLFAGKGFVADSVLAQGTRNDPLGQPLAGASKELDAMAAYLASLDHVNPSPYRRADGTMTPQALAGEAVFNKLGCDFCHSGPDMTDSARGLLHDVGTIKASSGTRAKGPLLGIDTPTLLGVWETAPYLHDGSAATLRDVLTTANSKDQHGFVSSLGKDEVDQLVAYLQQLDNHLPPHRLPFEPAADAGADGGGDPIASAEGGEAGQGEPVTEPRPAPSSSSSLGCSAAPGTHAAGWGALGPVVVLLGWVARRRRDGGMHEVRS